MKQWKLILIGGFLGFIVIKVLIINPLTEKPKEVSDEGEVIATDQYGRVVSVNEMLEWKPEVNLEFKE